MSEMDEKAVETATAAIDEARDIAVEVTTRALNMNRVGFYFLGVGMGATAGYFLARHLLKTKYAKIADSEIDEMRTHYQAKIRAAEAAIAKRPVEEIIKERGYSTVEEDEDEDEDRYISPPIVVRPPTPAHEVHAQRKRDEAEREAQSKVKNIFRERHPEPPPVNFEWDWHEERKKRSPDRPYVIHYDEIHDSDGYHEVTLTLYDKDGVICNERDEPMDPDDIDTLLGEKNLERFGHGSPDPVIVYIRNDKLEIVYEVIKSPNSFSEEVHGFSHDSGFRGNLERMRIRERDEQED